MDPALLEFLGQTVTREAFAAEDRDGKPTAAAPSSPIACRYVEKVKLVTGTDGEVARSTSNVIMDGNVIVDHRDFWNLPNGRREQPLAFERHPDEDGNTDHTRIFF